MFNSIKLLAAVSLSATLLLSGCASSGGQPSWITATPENYPEEKYLTASASADEQTSADSRSLANLARIFEVAIEDSAIDFSQATVTTAGDISQVSNEQRAARSVNTFANQVLEGARVVEHWRAETGPHFSLAVLEKAPAAKRFRDAIRNIDQQTDDLRDYAVNQANNPVAALSALDKARLLQLERAQLNRNLSVLTGNSLPSKISAALVETQIREALAVLAFDVNTTPTELNPDLQAAVANLGAKVSASSAYIIEGVLDTEPVEKKQGWYWLRGSLELSLVKNGETQAKQRWPIKVSATDKGMVAQRAKDQLAGELTNYLYQLLTAEKINQ
jgi:outer membrane murein-binding lipoprotein Lpp